MNVISEPRSIGALGISAADLVGCFLSAGGGCCMMDVSGEMSEVRSNLHKQYSPSSDCRL